MEEEAEAEITLLYISSASLNVNHHTPLSTLADWEALGFMTSEVQRGVRGACQALLDIEKEFINFDTVLEDGDCGEMFVQGSRGTLIIHSLVSKKAARTPLPRKVVAARARKSIGDSTRQRY